MDSVVKDYRQKHKRCKFCKWYHYYFNILTSSFSKCMIKDKIIYHLDYSRWYCKYYEADE